MKIGDIVENFTLKDQNGNEFDLYGNLDKKVLLVFYPKDNSPVCSRQLSEYQFNIDEFNKNGIKVVGINTESVDSHLTFCNNQQINFPLLSDIDKKVSRSFDALTLLGLNKRKIVLIDTDKKIKYTKSVAAFRYPGSGYIFEELNKLQIVLWA